MEAGRLEGIEEDLGLKINATNAASNIATAQRLTKVVNLIERTEAISV